MNARDKIFDLRTFDDEALSCPHCSWSGTGLDAHVAGFYGLSKYKEVLCPKCNEYLGNLPRDIVQRHRQSRPDPRLGPI